MMPIAPALTHMGIFTDRPEAMQSFYETVLGMLVSDAGRGMLFKRRIIFMTGDPLKHHQFVLVVREEGDPPGGALFQISFKVKTLDELRRVVDRANAHGATGLREMNHGNSWSVYFRDPDANVVEIYMDTGWYVPQPFAVHLPLELSDEQIRAITAERVKEVAGSMPQEAWSQEIAARLERHRSAQTHAQEGQQAGR